VSEPQTWRTVLGTIIQNAQEKQRIARELHVSPITLTRWASGESIPRSPSLQHLVLVVPPQYREPLLALIEEEFEGFLSSKEEGTEHIETMFIPVEFYARVLHTKAETSRTLLFSSLCDLILQQALKQLDPYRVGMAITVARCMPLHHENKVRSLREITGRGTAPWNDSLDQQGILLGVESLAGHAVISGHLEINQRLGEKLNVSPGYQSEWEKSAVATPIMRTGMLAGSLLVSSTRSNYFLPAISRLVENYADLIALAFEPGEFYEPKQIELNALPPFAEQVPYIAQFRQGVIEMMLQAMRNKRPITVLQAEQLVWQQIEEQLLSQSFL